MQVVTAPTRQTVAEVEAYWTETRMEQAQAVSDADADGDALTEEGTLIPMAEPTGSPAVARTLPGGASLCRHRLAQCVHDRRSTSRTTTSSRTRAGR